MKNLENGCSRMRLFIVFMLSVIFLPSYRGQSQDMHSESSIQIFGHVDFDNREIGESYGGLDVKGDFGTLMSLGANWPMRRCEIVEADSVHGKVLRVNYPKNKVRSMQSGASWKWKPFYPRQDVTLSYYVFFPDSFEFRAGGKLHGLIGGKGNTGGKKPNGHDGWSCRVHWGDGDKIKLYVYFKDQALKWGDTFYFTKHPETIYLDQFDHKWDNANMIHVERGMWHHVMVRVKVNAVGFKNGLAQAWWDGKLVTDVRGVEFRDETCGPEDLLVDGMYFSSFFGGRGENYKPVKDEYILFDDFIVSNQPVSIINSSIVD